MTEEEFQKHISALSTKRLEKPKKLGSQFAQYWSEIFSQQYNFDRGKLLNFTRAPDKRGY